MHDLNESERMLARAKDSGFEIDPTITAARTASSERLILGYPRGDEGTVIGFTRNGTGRDIATAVIGKPGVPLSSVEGCRITGQPL